MDELAARRDALRQAATAPGADPWTLLDAALTELDGAVDALGEAETILDGGDPPGGRVPDTLRAERRLLRAAFQHAPAALLLLAANGTIRRASDQAAALLGAPTGYATGKQLTVFVDLPQRAAVQTQLAAAVRTGEPREVACRMLTADGLAEVTLAVTVVDLPGDPPVLAATVTPRAPVPLRGRARKPDRAPAKARPDEPAGDVQRVAAMARRLDMVTAVTRMLLDNATFNEAVTLQRCARLLAGEFADWVIVDVARGGELRRQVVAGPRGPEADQVARAVHGVRPEPSTLPGQVHAAGKSVLLAHASDPAALGSAADSTPLLMTLRAASLLVVPIGGGTRRGEASGGGSNSGGSNSGGSNSGGSNSGGSNSGGSNSGYGTLTLVRGASSGHFTVADLALAEDLCGHLATAMRVDQMFRRRSEAAEALEASLLPERLPQVPGLELAASYIGRTRRQEISGDFYDVFPTPSGWAVAVGDVSGIGHGAAAMSAAARHTIRALAHVHRDPADVLAAASEVLLPEDFGERYATSLLAFPDPGSPEEGSGGRCRVRLGTAGHPGPAVVRGDGRVEILSGDGFPLGLVPPGWFPDDRPARLDAELDAGDTLLFYTDGISQARSEDAEFFDDRLADALAETAGQTAAETVHVLSERLTDFCRGEFRDDITLLAMRVR